VVQYIFYVFGMGAVVGALMCVTQRNPIASAFWLVSVMLSLAGIYVLLNAQFLAVMQVLVYAGAIMVLFLFVIMLLNLGSGETDLRGKFSWVLAIVIAGALTVTMAQLAHYSPEQLAFEVSGNAELPVEAVLPEGSRLQETVEARGVVGAIAQPLFLKYFIPFQITGVLLLAAIVGAVVLAKRRI
jgi:NADH-quinone oxidoreductase subunit J